MSHERAEFRSHFAFAAFQHFGLVYLDAERRKTETAEDDRRPGHQLGERGVADRPARQRRERRDQSEDLRANPCSFPRIMSLKR